MEFISFHGRERGAFEEERRRREAAMEEQVGHSKKLIGNKVYDFGTQRREEEARREEAEARELRRLRKELVIKARPVPSFVYQPAFAVQRSTMPCKLREELLFCIKMS
mmetsp:Transcript_33039/g.87694  ORF Transcript_33039/g.87694 Transcript_33039/m.87694 type:complete len:108 (-) Transcript_33039:503-826(-)